jgi:hypothetical protein
MDVRLKAPFSLGVIGMSGSGKSVFTFKLIEYAEELITPPPKKIIYCYGEYQEIFDNFRHVNFHQGLPDLSEFIGNKEPILMVLDDLMSEWNEEISKLFTKYSHHRNISVVYLSQNLFSKNKHARVISLNTHYLVLMRNTRDVTQIGTLARQMYPKNAGYMIDAYNDAIKPNYGYLFVDLKPTTDDRIRLRSRIFPDESPAVVYGKKI